MRVDCDHPVDGARCARAPLFSWQIVRSETGRSQMMRFRGTSLMSPLATSSLPRQSPFLQVSRPFDSVRLASSLMTCVDPAAPPEQNVRGICGSCGGGPAKTLGKEPGRTRVHRPPLSTNVTLVLESGSYVLACFMTAAGDPPEHRRMFRPLHVVPAPDAASTEPPTNLMVKILDDGYEFLSLALGRSTLVTSRKRDIPKPYVPNRADSSRSNRRGGARMEAGTPDGSRNCTPRPSRKDVSQRSSRGNT